MKTRLTPGMAIPLKAISIAFWTGGLIFEGLMKLCLGRDEKLCWGFCARSPQRSARCNVRWNSFEISPFGEHPSRLRRLASREFKRAEDDGNGASACEIPPSRGDAGFPTASLITFGVPPSSGGKADRGQCHIPLSLGSKTCFWRVAEPSPVQPFQI